MENVVLITGASGYVGARLYEDLSKSFRTIGTYNSKPLFKEFEKLDITDKNAVVELVKRHKPSFIIHAAANASSKSCDSDPAAAIRVNETGTKNIVEAANAVGAVVVYISATVAELQKSYYEKTKFSGENIVKGSKAGFVILKPSVIFGMSPNMTTDKPFNQILRNIQGTGPFTYDTSWRFQPTWIAHISETIDAIIRSGIRNTEALVVVPDMKSKFDIANDILVEFGKKAEPVNEKSWRPSTEFNLKKEEQLGLPTKTYEEMRDGIVNEVKNYLAHKR